VPVAEARDRANGFKGVEQAGRKLEMKGIGRKLCVALVTAQGATAADLSLAPLCKRRRRQCAAL
jgi:hypothetical protein